MYSHRFSFEEQRNWPPGAWLVRCGPGSREFRVHHGSGVAIHGQWFGELVWDGPYTQSGFDKTDIVFGSGAKLTSEGIQFVSSACTMDRLQYLQSGDAWLVSNSLACLLAYSDSHLEKLKAGYRRDFMTIIQGMDDYCSTLSTTDGKVELVYYDNLVFNGTVLKREAKPVVIRDLSTYERYRDFLISALQRCAENMQSDDRPEQMRYEWLGTISTGFDSPTVSALAQPAGLRNVVTFAQARGGADDNGSGIAQQLGLEATILNRDEWQRSPMPEVPFLASDAKGEDVYVAALGESLSRKVLLTGFAAGPWKATGRANPALTRDDQSGLSITEYRLWANFVHMPVPCLGAVSVSPEDLQRLAEEMKPWASGEKYDKPFCRRVLVERGVPNRQFGQQKKAASVLMYDRRTMLTRESRADFYRYLWQARKEQPVQAMFVMARSMLLRGLSWGAKAMLLCARLAAGLAPLKILRHAANSTKLGEAAHYEPHAEYLFAWAMDHAKKRYKRTDNQASAARKS